MPTFDHAGVALHYEVHGDGPWLVFAHGAGGNALSWWQQVPAFASRYRCLIYDQRGWGRSSSGAAPDPALFADDLAALLDHLAVDDAALVGQSMGGWSVLGAALLRPARVKRIALVGTIAGLTDDDLLARLGQFHAGNRGFDPHQALAADFPQRRPDLTFLYDQICGLNPPVSPEFLLRLLALRHTERAVAELRVPVRFIAGAKDQLFPLELVRLAQAKLPGSDLVVLPAAGHSGYFECAAEFNRALAEHLA